MMAADRVATFLPLQPTVTPGPGVICDVDGFVGAKENLAVPPQQIDFAIC